MKRFIGITYRGVRKIQQIDKSTIAKVLRIPKHIIVRIELWKYVIFVHRRDRGGQFVSYRLLQQWFHMIASQINNCQSLAELLSLWYHVEKDFHNHSKQYHDKFLAWVLEVWRKCWVMLFNARPTVKYA